MVRRVVARRVRPDRPASWADLVTHAQWEALRPAFRADRRLQAECRVVLSRLPAGVRGAFVTELVTQLRRRGLAGQAVGLAVEASARRALTRPRRGRALPLLATAPGSRRMR